MSAKSRALLISNDLSF